MFLTMDEWFLCLSFFFLQAPVSPSSPLRYCVPSYWVMLSDRTSWEVRRQKAESSPEFSGRGLQCASRWSCYFRCSSSLPSALGLRDHVKGGRMSALKTAFREKKASVALSAFAIGPCLLRNTKESVTFVCQVHHFIALIFKWLDHNHK